MFAVFCCFFGFLRVLAVVGLFLVGVFIFSVVEGLGLSCCFVC